VKVLWATLRTLGIVAGFFVIAESAMRVQRFALAGLDPWEMSTVKRVLMSEFGLEPPVRSQASVGSWGLMPNMVGWNKGERFEVNNLGLRGEDTTRERPDDVLRVAAIGGSLTMAAGVPLAETWTEALEARLNEELSSPLPGARRTWEVLNLGVPNTRRCLQRHLDRALYFEPDLILVQIGWVGSRQEFKKNFTLAARFARQHSIQVLAFALNDDEHVAPSNRFFTLLEPLDVSYGPEHYIYPSDDHPDGSIHEQYAERLLERIAERRQRLLRTVATIEPDHTTTYQPLRPKPWGDPDRGFWHCYVWERLTTSFAVTRARVLTLGRRVPWSGRKS
jgi:hypothetical protein